MSTQDDKSKESKGCFQCSKRRIVCDGREPVCLKCQKKGLECSGSGRIRFSTGVARRGKLKGCTIPVASVSPEAALERQVWVANCSPRQIRWKNDAPVRRSRKNATRTPKRDAENSQGQLGLSDSITPDQVRGALALADRTSGAGAAEPGQPSPPRIIACSNIAGDFGYAQNSREDVCDRDLEPQWCIRIDPWVAPLSPRARMFMSHCENLLVGASRTALFVY
ncbi:hypothetical protein N7462_006653 [Penicillium macrosclerotiorum]|uniref:uncharacterized protein n=1 Tax=Penicillium macrosclerotiorum TaxID=303699 RepID=UPI0025476478|nr:uncharacterized protein N7462_006653 [Penicillium macrosclerotiorum]KAJ5683488.1 hypothetical protein N7462_006653 [Penicillium macrosclerotiorum]